jgi:hypothetical protein
LPEVTKVRVYKITSINDPDTGQPGKQIELVETRTRTSQTGSFGVGGDEAKMVKGILGQLQSMGMFPHIPQVILPKMTLFLTEQEYERLNIRFEVNDTYDVHMKDGVIAIRKAVDGV